MEASCFSAGKWPSYHPIQTTYGNGLCKFRKTGGSVLDESIISPIGITSSYFLIQKQSTSKPDMDNCILEPGKEGTSQTANNMYKSNVDGTLETRYLDCNNKNLWSDEPKKEASQTLGILIEQGTQLDLHVYVNLLRECSGREALVIGRKIHAHVLRFIPNPSVFLFNEVVYMYLQCGSLIDAVCVFQTMSRRNVFSWTLLISGYANYDSSKKALEAFQDMQEEGIKPNKVTFVLVLGACANMGSLKWGKLANAHIVRHESHLDVHLGSAVVNMYVKCGSNDDAHQVFDVMSSLNVVSFNALILGYAQTGKPKDVLILLKQMRDKGVGPNAVTFVNVITACGTTLALEHGKILHSIILQVGTDVGLYVGSALVNMYAKCGSIGVAHHIFNTMQKQDLILWNVIITGYAQHENGREALKLLKQMQYCGIGPDKVTFINVLNACAHMSVLHHGKQAHADILLAGYESDVSVSNTLIDMYGKCNRTLDAYKVFLHMPRRDVISWNSVIGAQFDGTTTLALFWKMQQEISEPDQYTYANVISICADSEDLQGGKLIHGQMLKTGVLFNVYVASSLLDMYAKCGSMKDAGYVFDNMSPKNVVSWTAIIAGYVQQNNGKQALELFIQMYKYGLQANGYTFVSVLSACVILQTLVKGKLIHAHVVSGEHLPNTLVENMLIDMYMKCGSLEDACHVFAIMPILDVVSWTALLAGYSAHGFGKEVIELFEKMQHNMLKLQDATFCTILAACAEMAALDQARQIHELIKTEYELSTIVGNALIDMYFKCGSIEDAQEVFDQMPVRNVISWTAIIGGYGQHGHGGKALEVFMQMQRQSIKADEVLYISVLSACSHAGLIGDGCHYFIDLASGRQPCRAIEQHYACMVDLIGRAGHLDEAEELIVTMPLQPIVSVWMAFVGAYRIYNGLTEFVE